MNSTLDVLKLLLDKQLNMPQGRVWAYNSEVFMPKDTGLFIVLYIANRRVIGNNMRYKPTENGLQTVQKMNVQENIVIACISKDTSARDRAQEVLFALNSDYAQQLQEKYHMHFSTTGEMIDMSELEGTAMINRTDIRISVLKGYDKVENVEFYDKFPNTSKLEPEWHVKP